MPEKVRGLVESGNVGDLTDRPRVKNADGSVSTIRSMSFNDGKREVLIPTANDGVVQSDDDAISRYEATGEHLGKFDTPEAATAYAEKLHLAQEAQTRDGAQVRKEQPRSAPRNAAVDNVPRAERLERPEDREARYLEKARKSGYVHNDLAQSLDKYRGNEEQDNRIRQGISDALHPAPVMRAADATADYAKEHTSQGTRDRLKSGLESFVDWVNPAVGNARRDAKIAEQARAIEIAKRYLQPRDGGEIEDPAPAAGVRDISSVRREFSNENEKDAYIERIRKAQAAAKK
jgi:hypothetical protein